MFTLYTLSQDPVHISISLLEGDVLALSLFWGGAWPNGIIPQRRLPARTSTASVCTSEAFTEYTEGAGSYGIWSVIYCQNDDGVMIDP